MRFDSTLRWTLIALAPIAALLGAPTAQAFGDDGHQVVALIAEHYLAPAARHKVFALLATDSSGLTAAHDIASEATWADRWRDSDRHTTRTHYEQTRRWHFADVEIDSPDLDTACFGHPALPAGVPASAGPPQACVVDKIVQFEHELASATTSAGERLLALQFVLHLVGDVHQPLHASDDHDQGGNTKQVRLPGRAPGPLHHQWDTEFVRNLGANPAGIAQTLIAGITPQQKQLWASGSVSDWAGESFRAGRDFAYAKLPPPQHGVRPLSPAYVKGADKLVAQQLSKAGVRLATLLNRSFGESAASTAP